MERIDHIQEADSTYSRYKFGTRPSDMYIISMSSEALDWLCWTSGLVVF